MKYQVAVRPAGKTGGLRPPLIKQIDLAHPPQKGASIALTDTGLTATVEYVGSCNIEAIAPGETYEKLRDYGFQGRR